MLKKSVRYFLLFLLLVVGIGIARLGPNDLKVYRMAGALALQDQPERAYRESATIGNYFDGPPFLALAKSLANLPEKEMHWVWIGIQSLAYCAFWIFLLKLYPTLWNGPLSAFFLVWVTSIKPLHASFQSQNLQMIFAAILLGAEVFIRTQKPFAEFVGGALVSILTGMKIYPGFIAVFYFITKSKRTRWGIIGGVAMALLIPAVVFGLVRGPALYLEFVSNLRTYHGAYPLARQAVSLSLPSLVARWFEPMGLELVVKGISVLVMAISLTFFGWVALKRKTELSQSLDLWALTLALMVFLNNGSRPDYFVFYLPAFASLSTALAKGELSQGAKWALGVAVALICFISDWTLQSRDLNHYLESLRIPVIGMFALCGALFYFVSKQRNSYETTKKHP